MGNKVKGLNNLSRSARNAVFTTAREEVQCADPFAQAVAAISGATNIPRTQVERFLKGKQGAKLSTAEQRTVARAAVQNGLKAQGSRFVAS